MIACFNIDYLTPKTKRFMTVFLGHSSHRVPGRVAKASYTFTCTNRQESRGLVMGVNSGARLIAYNAYGQ